jgi:hypothetical protein
LFDVREIIDRRFIVGNVIVSAIPETIKNGSQIYQVLPKIPKTRPYMATASNVEMRKKWSVVTTAARLFTVLKVLVILGR